MRVQSALLMATAIGLLSLPLMAASPKETLVESGRMAGYDEDPALEPLSGPDIDIYSQMSFDQFDVNKDGTVNPSEFLSGNPSIKGVLNDFVRLDADNDGGLTRAEFRSAGLDAGNADLPGNEADAVLNRDPNVAGGDFVGSGGNSFETQAHQDLAESIELDELDTNRDSIVTRQEFMASVDAEFSDTIFTRLDMNNDGRITRDELETAGLATGLTGRSLDRETRYE